MHQMRWSSPVPFGGLSGRSMSPASIFPRRAASPHHSAAGVALRYLTQLAADTRRSSQPAHSTATPAASLIGTRIGLLALLGMSMARAFPRKDDYRRGLMFLLGHGQQGPSPVGRDRPPARTRSLLLDQDTAGPGPKATDTSSRSRTQYRGLPPLTEFDFFASMRRHPAQSPPSACPRLRLGVFRNQA